MDKYEFNWCGKSKSIELANIPSTGTLKLDKESSKNWDTTENIYIEGDNLEVLKLLQKSYFGKVKMIYIDPPYNTGNDFIYKDDFKDSIKNYKEQTEQGMSSNPETNGRYHTDWLNMMYPRLILARNLLCEDGLIFISISNQELSNLKMICDEIFGYKNCLGIIDWESKTKCQNTKTAKYQLQNKQEYILVYQKVYNKYKFKLKVKEKRCYPEIDENGYNFRLEQIGEMSASGIRGRDTMIFPIEGIYPKEGNQWKVGIDTVKSFKERNDLIKKDDRVYFRIRPEDEEDKMEPFWSFISKDIGTAETAKSELKRIIGEHGFETVKPVDLIEKLIFHVCDNDDIILDFFSGTATTAHATLKINQNDLGKRKFILVQIPELLDTNSIAYKAGYKNICEIGKERIRRAGDKIVSENKDKEGIENLDIGFKVFKLDSCENMSEEDLIYKAMLENGIELIIKDIEKLNICNNKVYNINQGELLICFTNDLNKYFLQELGKYKNKNTKVLFFYNN